MFFKTLIFWFMMIPCSAATFEFKCPHLSQRRFRAIGVCQDESKYSCLLDIIKEAYIEMCNQAKDFVVRGEKYVISGGRRSYPCSSDRYQPFKFWLHVQSQCYYKKTSCNEDGQIIYSNTSAKDDNMCRCNFTNGYGLITKPRNACYCIPSQEDCSCYKVQCPANTTLSSDEKCSVNGSYGGTCNTVGTIRFDKSSLNITLIAVEDLFAVRMHKVVILPLIASTLGISVIAVILLLKYELTKDNSSEECEFTEDSNSKECELTEESNSEEESEVKEDCNSKARFQHLKTSSIALNQAIKDLKAKKIKLTVLKPEDKQNFPSLFIQRVNRYSVDFVMELSLYPKIPERAVESSVEIVPLVDDVKTAIDESVRSGGFKNLIEKFFRGKEVLEYIRPPNNQVEISVIMENSTRNDTQELPTDISCKMSDDSYILLVANKQFLHKELQPQVIAKKFLKTNEFKEYCLKDERSSQVEFLISKINEKNRFDDFLKITKKKLSYVHRRLVYTKKAYHQRHLISRNIIRNIYDLSARKGFVLDDFQQIFVEREVFTNEIFSEIERSTNDAKKQMLEFLVKTILTGTIAMFTFVDALYLNAKHNLAESLISSESILGFNRQSGNNNTDIIEQTTQEDILLLARFEACFTSEVLREIDK